MYLVGLCVSAPGVLREADFMCSYTIINQRTGRSQGRIYFWLPLIFLIWETIADVSKKLLGPQTFVLSRRFRSNHAMRLVRGGSALCDARPDASSLEPPHTFFLPSRPLAEQRQRRPPPPPTICSTLFRFHLGALWGIEVNQLQC